MEKKKIYTVILLCAALSGAIYYFATSSIENQKKKEITAASENIVNNKGVLNDKYNLYDDVSDMIFTTEDGTDVRMGDFKGKNVVVTYWDSAFDDSKIQVSEAEKLKKSAKQYNDTEYILVHRSDDNDPQIKENALRFIEDNNINVRMLFDSNMNVHSRLGLESVPATFSVNSDGRLVSLNKAKIIYDNEFKNIINKTRDSSSYITEKFMRDEMIGDDGGVNITLNDDKISAGTTVLSESQGIMIEYANIKGEEDLFNSTLNYINKYMKNDSLISWKVENGEASRVNAAIDDLRVYDALYNGIEKFGVNEKELKKYSRSIYKYNVEKDNLVDCYDFANNQKSQRLTLCYGDFNALGELWAENWRFKKVYNNTLEVVKNGYIGDGFPLYYSWYNYQSSEYEKDDLNISEALVTILHLSEIGEAKPQTISWLKEQVKNGTLYGRYTVEGKVSEGFEYESTAAYALAVLIGKEVNDSELIDNALVKMERMKIDDLQNKYYGAFGNPDGSGIYSFDQCMALLAYAELEK